MASPEQANAERGAVCTAVVNARKNAEDQAAVRQARNFRQSMERN
jgi:hypothetical protein